MRRVVTVLFVLVLLAPPSVGLAEDRSESTAKHTSYEAAAAVGTVVYTPVKAGLCAIGGAVSGLVFLSSGPRAARAVAGRSCLGTWVLTADVLEGKKPLNLVSDNIRFPGD